MNEEPPVLLEEQPNPDAEWIITLPTELQGVARRHGRAVVVYLVNMQASQYSTQVLLKRIRGNRELELALVNIVNTLNDLSQQYVLLKDWIPAFLSEVKKELDTAVELSNTGPGKKSNGGIILPH